MPHGEALVMMSQLNASQFVSGWQFEDRFILGGAGNSSASITNGMKEAELANPNIILV